MTGRSGKLLIEMLDEDMKAASSGSGGGDRSDLLSPAAAPPTPGSKGRHPSISIPLSTLYISAAMLMGLVLLVWAVGYSVGEKAGRRQVVSEQAPSNLSITQPVLSGQPVAAPPIRANPASPAVVAKMSPKTSSTKPKTPASARSASAPILTPAGWVGVEPRVNGSNYLELAVLPVDQAVSAVKFLAAGGVRAIAVPDRRGMMRLISIELPVPSGRYRQMGSERRAHERRIEELGARWAREQSGGSDFSQPLWRKYGG